MPPSLKRAGAGEAGYTDRCMEYELRINMTSCRLRPTAGLLLLPTVLAMAPILTSRLGRSELVPCVAMPESLPVVLRGQSESGSWSSCELHGLPWAPCLALHLVSRRPSTLAVIPRTS